MHLAVKTYSKLKNVRLERNLIKSLLIVMRNLHTVSNLLLNMKLLYTTPDGTTYNCHVLDDINFHWPCLRGGGSTTSSYTNGCFNIQQVIFMVLFSVRLTWFKPGFSYICVWRDSTKHTPLLHSPAIYTYNKSAVTSAHRDGTFNLLLKIILYHYYDSIFHRSLW